MSANRDIEYVQSVGVNPAVYGNYRPIEDNVEDHGPFYLYSVGEPIHRVPDRDTVTHIYPGLVTPCVTGGRWYPARELEISSPVMATNESGEKLAHIPTYAGEIKNKILNRYGRQGVISIDAFARVKEESLNLPFFNDQLMPVPLFYGDDDLPVEKGLPTEMKALFGGWERKFKDYEMAKKREELTEKVGGLKARRNQVEVFLAELKRGDHRGEISTPLAKLYVEALTQILQAFDAFATFAKTYLAQADKLLKDAERSGKYVYDDRDIRLQWLMNLRGIDAPIVEQLKMNQQPIQVVLPEQKTAQVADIERKPCEECGELIAVAAKRCRYCQTQFGVAVAAVAVGAEAVTVIEADSFDPADPFDEQKTAKKTIEQKQAEMKAKYKKN